MNATENLRLAAQSVLEQWKRSILTSTGVFIGTAAILLLVSIALGVRSDLTDQVNQLGVNVLVVIPGLIEDGTFNPNLGGFSYLTEDDAKRISTVPGVIRAEPFSFVGGGIRYRSTSAYPLLAAATPGWFLMRPVQMQSGRVFQPADESKDVCVLGGLAASKLFPHDNPIGKTVDVNQRKYQVIGVTKDDADSKSPLAMFSLQNVAYLPYHRLKSIYPGFQTSRIMIQSAQDAEPKALVKKIDHVLGARLDRQQYQVLTEEQILGLVYRLSGILTWLLTGLTSIGLIVGGVGVMAIMLLSVNERVGEIGVRKAVGARRRDVFLQFLYEAMIISLFGGVSGLIFSVLIGRLLSALTPIHPLLSLAVVGLGIGFSLLIGCTFGVIPAIRAAKKDPCEALRAL